MKNDKSSTPASGAGGATGEPLARPGGLPPETPAQRRRAKIFSTITLLLGAIAIVLLTWRIVRAWRIEYGNGPREPRPMPTSGAFGPPGGPAAPPPPSAEPAPR